MSKHLIRSKIRPFQADNSIHEHIDTITQTVAKIADMSQRDVQLTQATFDLRKSRLKPSKFKRVDLNNRKVDVPKEYERVKPTTHVMYGMDELYKF